MKQRGVEAASETTSVQKFPPKFSSPPIPSRSPHLLAPARPRSGVIVSLPPPSVAAGHPRGGWAPIPPPVAPSYPRTAACLRALDGRS
jgi:hypothetical protein